MCARRERGWRDKCLAAERGNRERDRNNARDSRASGRDQIQKKGGRRGKSRERENTNSLPCQMNKRSL